MTWEEEKAKLEGEKAQLELEVVRLSKQRDDALMNIERLRDVLATIYGEGQRSLASLNIITINALGARNRKDYFG